MDWSTINIIRLGRLPKYKLPPTYHVSDSMGAGCFLDPPGYPTYFLRSVYTQHGNTPPNSAQEVISRNNTLYIARHSNDWEGNKSWDDVNGKHDKLMRQLWQPLPMQHERTQLWIAYLKGYFKNCFVDPRKEEGLRNNASELHIGAWSPEEVRQLADILDLENLPDTAWACLKNLREDPAKDISLYTDIELYAQMSYLKLALDVHILTDRATLYIQRFYPEYKYTELPADYPGERGNWWETEAEQPKTEEECNTTQRNHGETWRHPVNRSWCQWCGRRAE